VSDMQTARTLADVGRRLRIQERIEGGRIRIVGDLTLYVRTDGDDTNDGQTNDAAGAFATIQAAADAVCGWYDPGPYTITIQVQSATWTLPSTLTLRRHIGTEAVVIRGDTTTPANCVIQYDGGTVIHCLSEWAPWKVEGLTVQRVSTGNVILVLAERGNLKIGRLALGNPGTSYQLFGTSKSYISATGATIDVLAGGAGLLRMADQSQGYLNNVTWVFPGGGANYTVATMSAASQAAAYVNGDTFTNGALVTGVRYSTDALAHIRTNGGGANYIPGNAAGTATNGGIYT
jgi:hypothetical protein